MYIDRVLLTLGMKMVYVFDPRCCCPYCYVGRMPELLAMLLCRWSGYRFDYWPTLDAM